jgi:hypothetical protein
MQRLFRTSLRLAPAVLVLLGITISASAQNAKLQLDQLDALANRALETVDVKLDEHMMQTTAKLFSGKDPEDVDIKELLKNVKGIYVKSFTFERENEFSPAEIDSVRTQLRSGAWTKVVGVSSKRQSENVEVYLMTVADQISGLALLSINPKELTVVNIVGPINLEKLTQLEGSFGVPDLDLVRPKTKKDDDQ